MARRGKLAGDMLAVSIQAAFDEHRARSGPTDPESLLEFMLYGIPFRTEPAVGVVFPPAVTDAE